MATRPNILFVVPDQLGASWLPTLENGQALSEESITFAHLLNDAGYDMN